MWKKAYCSLWFLLALGIHGSSAIRGAEADAKNSEATIQTHALKVLREDCANCHGLYRSGGLGPPLTPASLKNYQEETLAAIIKEGRPYNFMPPWKELLSDAEINYLSHYLLNQPVQQPPPQKVP